jgi:hypothetical protein
MNSGPAGPTPIFSARSCSFPSEARYGNANATYAPMSQKLMPKSNACLKNAWLCSSFKAHYYSSFDAANWQTLR